MLPGSISFIDLGAQRDRLRPSLDAAIARVLDHGKFIMGPEVSEFEQALSTFTGATNVISCANGTDALQLVLMAENIGSGDAVFIPAFTFVATAEVVPLLGATPIFVDVCEDTFNMNPDSLAAAIVDAKGRGLNPRAVIAVDLFGQPADYKRINAIAEDSGLIVIADAAQALGAEIGGKRVGTLATWTTTSFFPSKPLGCYGDGGAIFTDDINRANMARSLRLHGKGSDKYDNIRIGVNSRLDTLQAAILLEKLAVFEDELAVRDRIADAYTQGLSDRVPTPRVTDQARSAWAQYTILVDDRESMQTALAAAGVPTAVYYPIPMNRQGGYWQFPVAPGGVSISERLAAQVISLPMHPYLQDGEIAHIIGAVRDVLKQTRA